MVVVMVVVVRWWSYGVGKLGGGTDQTLTIAYHARADRWAVTLIERNDGGNVDWDHRDERGWMEGELFFAL